MTQQNFRRSMEDYITVDMRIALARKKYGERLAIICDKPVFIVDKDGNHLAGLFHCTIKVDDKVIATGNASTTELAEEKSIEAAESAAVGRALKHAGFAAREEFMLSDDETEEETKEFEQAKQTIQNLTQNSRPAPQELKENARVTLEAKQAAREVLASSKTKELKNKFFRLNDLRRE